MVRNLILLLLVSSFISLCLCQESNVNEESLLGKILNVQKNERSKRALFYRNDKETMERERRLRNGIPEYYDDYYYDDYYYNDYYYDDYYPFYYDEPIINNGIPRPYGVGLSRYNKHNDNRRNNHHRRNERKGHY